MRTLIDATLFIVNGPRGAYYAIQENESGAVLTERTENAAVAIANERDMVIVDRREITHAELLAMLASRCETQPGVAASDQPLAAAETRPGTSHAQAGLGDGARRLLPR